MRTELCRRLGCELPIFAFSHCRDVIVEVTKAGGFGVLGSSTHSPAQLEQELAWIDAHVDGRAYGVDVLIPVTYDKEAEAATRPIAELVPPQYKAFVNDFLEKEGVPTLPAAVATDWERDFNGRAQNNTPAGAQRLIDVTLRHPQVTFIVSALGAPPCAMVDDFHARGILVGALCGKPDHVPHHRAVGVDVLIAQGTEAGGHTGTISTMVLVPQVVEAAAGEMAVLAAGGISRGSQIAASLALGAQGVWCGTIWLGTRESELTPVEKEVLFAARTEDAVQRKWQTGKPVRLIRSKLSEMWEVPGALKHLPAPLQGVLYHYARVRVERAGRTDLLSFPAGQVVGTLKHETSAKDVVYQLMNEYADTMERLTEFSQSSE